MNKRKMAGILERLIPGFVILLTLPSVVWSQDGGLDIAGFGRPGGASGKRVTVSAEVVAGTDQRPAELQLTAQVLAGWHIYSITQKPGGPKPTRINLVASDQYRLLGKFKAIPPAIAHHYDFWPGLDVEEHQGLVTWSAPIEPLRPDGLRSLVISGDVQGQICKDICVDFSQSFAARLATGKASALTNPTVGPVAPPAADAGSLVTAYKTQYVMLTGQITPPTVEAGGRAQLTLTATLADNWHLYGYEKRAPRDSMRSRPTLIVLNERSGLEAGAPRASTALISKPREAFPEYVDNFHHGDVTWTIDLEIPASAQQGVHHLSGLIGFMACTDNQCAPPKAVRFAADIEIGPRSGGITAVTFSPSSYSAAAQAAVVAPPWDLVIPQAKSATFFAILLNMGWALIAGIFLNVMPCVLPVIGLKVMSFVQQAGESRWRIFTLNLAFSAGLISIFLALAFFAAFAGLAWAQQFQDPRFGIAMAALVFVFALSLLGIWEIPIPGFVGSGAAQSIAEREGLAAAFFKGVLTTLLATPCVGPFMFTGLTFAAEQHSPAITFAIFGAMGIGMALPFLLIGAFPAWIRFLPKPGVWMETFKYLMGFVLLATVVWIYYAFIPERYFVATLALLFGLWLACWWANRTPLTASLADRLYAWTVAAAVAALIGYVSFTRLTGAEAIALDPEEKVAAGDQTNGSWHTFSPTKLDAYREQGTTVLVDFTADG